MILIPLCIAICFLLGALLGAPYLRTLRRQREQALDLLDLKSGQTLLDLGSGDGSMLLAAAKRGIKSIGYEINPLLFLYSVVRCWPQRRLIQIRLASYWNTRLPQADGLYVFLIDRYMQQLARKLAVELHPGTKAVSYTFKIPGKKPAEAQGSLLLYRY